MASLLSLSVLTGKQNLRKGSMLSRESEHTCISSLKEGRMVQSHRHAMQSMLVNKPTNNMKLINTTQGSSRWRMTIQPLVTLSRY